MLLYELHYKEEMPEDHPDAAKCACLCCHRPYRVTVAAWGRKMICKDCCDWLESIEGGIRIWNE